MLNSPFDYYYRAPKWWQNPLRVAFILICAMMMMLVGYCSYAQAEYRGDPSPIMVIFTNDLETNVTIDVRVNGILLMAARVDDKIEFIAPANKVIILKWTCLRCWHTEIIHFQFIPGAKVSLSAKNHDCIGWEQYNRHKRRWGA